MLSMNLTGFDLNLLVAFEALNLERSVSKAAQRLGVRQPAMSASLARLRTLFGDELFVRAAGQMRPTAKALEITASVHAALAAAREAIGERANFTPHRLYLLRTATRRGRGAAGCGAQRRPPGGRL
jgi:DNA-binding transcriptional LysR family regulator